METDTTSRSNLLPSNFDSGGGSVVYSLCNTLWGPKLVPCTVESTLFPLHDSLSTVRQTDIQSPVWMITLLLTMTLSFMCNLCVRIHTPLYGGKKSQAQLPLFCPCVCVRTETFHGCRWSFCFTVTLTRNYSKEKSKNADLSKFGGWFPAHGSVNYLDDLLKLRSPSNHWHGVKRVKKPLQTRSGLWVDI